MATTETPTQTRECLGCGRTIRSRTAVARGYGSGCWAKVRKAERTADLSAWAPRQVDDAAELIEDGGVVPTAKPGVFRTVSSDGTAVYLTSAHWCGCPAGLKGRLCYHRAAAVVLRAATSTPARVPATVSEPAQADVTAPDDIWAALEAVGALDLIPAF